MTRGLVALAAALVVAAVAGSARADTFAVVTDASLPSPASAETPNAPGSLLLPGGWTTAASSQWVVSFAELSALWRQAGSAYGIPWNVLAAINKIETNFGRNMGPSSAGAVGWMQFMPDTWLRWGTDADGDGIADPWNPYDAIFSAARYLAAAGGREDLRRGIFAYNHADWYVRDVLALANLYGGAAPGELAFQLDRLQLALEEAQRQVAGVSERLTAAKQKLRRLRQQEAGLLRRAQGSALLSDALALQKRAGQVGVRADAVAARVEALRIRLAEARRDLQFARARTRGAVFSPGGRTLFGTPSYGGSYVFPVGGGPGAVSVSHTHHDYPAADIAAPAGAPLYALASGLVRNAWAEPQGKCGIGFSLDADDGQSWTYCHLSYLEPTVRAGAILLAGQPVGLVGSTGHSTGPHLHLQLSPATSYPQEQEWFESFAGSAFSWQDAPTPERFLSASIGGPVFAVEQATAIFAVVPSEPEGELGFVPTGGDAETVLFTRKGG